MTAATRTLSRPAALPVSSLGVVAVAALLTALPGAAERLEYDRAALEAGALWRALTGHLVHGSPSHLGWNLLGFGVLGALCEPRGRRTFWLCTLASAAVIPVVLYLGDANLGTYRGLSGVTSALFGWAAVTRVAEQWQAGLRPAALLGGACAAAFAARCAHAWVAGDTLFITHSAGVEPVPLAHVAGLLVGVGLALAGQSRHTHTQENGTC